MRGIIVIEPASAGIQRPPIRDVTPEIAQASKEFVDRLIANDYPVERAFWKWDDDAERWYFFIASNYVDASGPANAYHLMEGSFSSIFFAFDDVKAIAREEYKDHNCP